jgi:hypothetical protein
MNIDIMWKIQYHSNLASSALNNYEGKKNLHFLEKLLRYTLKDKNTP